MRSQKLSVRVLWIPVNFVSVFETLVTNTTSCLEQENSLMHDPSPMQQDSPPHRSSTPPHEVFCRVRPLLPGEVGHCVYFPADTIDEIGVERNDYYPPKVWNFDRVFQPNATNGAVFEQLESLVDPPLPPTRSSAVSVPCSRGKWVIASISPPTPSTRSVWNATTIYGAGPEAR